MAHIRTTDAAVRIRPCRSEYEEAAAALMQFPPELETPRRPSPKNLLAHSIANCENDSSLVMTGPCMASTLPKISEPRYSTLSTVVSISQKHITRRTRRARRRNLRDRTQGAHASCVHGAASLPRNLQYPRVRFDVRSSAEGAGRECFCASIRLSKNSRRCSGVSTPGGNWDGIGVGIAIGES